MRLVSIAAAVPLLVSCGGSNPAEPKPDTPSNAEDKRAGKDASKPAAAENTRAAGVSGTPLAGVTPELPHAMTDFRIEVGSLTSGFPRGWLLPDIPGLNGLGLTGFVTGSVGSVNPATVAAYEGWVATHVSEPTLAPPIHWWAHHRVALQTARPKAVAPWLQALNEFAQADSWRCDAVRRASPAGTECVDDSDRLYAVRSTGSRAIVDVFELHFSTEASEVPSEAGAPDPPPEPERFESWATDEWRREFGPAVAKALAARRSPAPASRTPTSVSVHLEFWGKKIAATTTMGDLVAVVEGVHSVPLEEREVVLTEGLGISRRCPQPEPVVFDGLRIDWDAGGPAHIDWKVAAHAEGLVRTMMTVPAAPVMPGVSELCGPAQACALWSGALDRKTLDLLAGTLVFDDGLENRCLEINPLLALSQTWPNWLAAAARDAGFDGVDGAGIIAAHDGFVAWVVAATPVASSKHPPGLGAAASAGSFAVRDKHWSYVASTDDFVRDLRRVAKLPAAAPRGPLDVRVAADFAPSVSKGGLDLVATVTAGRLLLSPVE